MYLCRRSTNALFICVTNGNKKNATESIPKTNYGEIIKKRIQRVKAAPRKLIIKKYINAIKSSQSAFFSKLPRKNIKHKQTRDCLIEIV